MVQVVFGDREGTTAIMPMSDITEFLAFSKKSDLVAGPSAAGLGEAWGVPYCLGAPMIIKPQGDGSYWENGKTYVLRFAAAQTGLLLPAHEVYDVVRMSMCVASWAHAKGIRGIVHGVVHGVHGLYAWLLCVVRCWEETTEKC